MAGWAAAALVLVGALGWAGVAGARRARAVALNESGVAAFENGDQEAAFRDFSRAIALDPDLEPACANLGMLSLSEGNLDRAVTILEECAGRFPGSAAVLAGLGRAHWDRGDLETAETRLRDSLDRMSEGDPSPLVVNDLALVLLEEGRAGEALDLLEMASFPPVGSLEGSVLRKTLGLARLQEGRTDQALAALERALSGPLPPEPLGAALVGLGKAREARGDPGGARKAYSRAILEAAGTPHADEARAALERLAREDQ